ncbi:YuiB family protein [Virgibacillus indicus]|uniref:YuiB family protein n=1 Tax=Virgibacillus indicus TaxID=2024554 RepID=UPI0013FD67A7|nr:YuiB family protein [Virgibacillus indicus]
MKEKVKGDTSLIQLVVSILLYFVIFFGIAFILNMLLRRTWLMSFIYPIIVIMIIDDLSTLEYFKNPGDSFSIAFTKLTEITPVDITILLSGLAGTIVSGIVIKILRKSGYQMF